MSAQTEQTFVVLEKVVTSDRKAGARVVPLELFKEPGQMVSTSIFADNRWIIGGVYKSTGSRGDDGRLDTLGVKAARFVEQADGDWTAAKLAERALQDQKDRDAFEARAKKEAGKLPEIDRLAAIVAAAKPYSRAHLATAIGNMILERSFSAEFRKR